MLVYRVSVEITPRSGIADPAGATIERSLPALGFDGVQGVRVGKLIQFSIEAADEQDARGRVEEMCKRFLANPVIEDSAITIGADE